jgi:hypothetical protein
MIRNSRQFSKLDVKIFGVQLHLVTLHISPKSCLKSSSGLGDPVMDLEG